MKYLFKKMFKDIWNFKTQFIAVFIMSLLSMFIYSGIEGAWNGMQEEKTQWFSESNMADLWVSGSAMTTNDITAIEKIKNVDSVQGTVGIPVIEKGSNYDGQITLLASNEETISKLYTVKGSSYTPTVDGVWLFSSYANEHNLKVGDTITLHYEENEISLKINGFVLSPEYLSYTGSSTTIQPDYKKYGYAYTSIEKIEELTGAPVKYSQLKITFDKTYDSEKNSYKELTNNKVEKVKDDVREVLGDKYNSFTTQENFAGISPFTDKIETIKMLSIVFSFVFILLVLMTIETTIKRMIEVQRIQIGTLKAIGYKNWKIRLHYALYGFFVSIVGCSIGYFIAPFTISKAIMNIQSKLYILPAWNSQNTAVSYLLIGLMTLFSTIVALVASRKGTKGMPAITMREEPPKNKKPIFLEHFSGFWNSLSYDWKWVLRDTFKNKKRTFIGIIGIIGSLALLITSLGIRDTFTHENKILYGVQYNYKTKVVLEPKTTEKEKKELQDLSVDSGQWSQESSIEIITANDETSSNLLIFEDGVFTHFKNTDGTHVSLPEDGAAITKKEANKLGIALHDSIQIKITGTKNTLTIPVKEIISAPSPQGIYLSKDTWEKFEQHFTPNVYLSGDESLLDKTEDLSYVKESTTLEDQLESANEIVHGVMIIIIMLLCGAILLCIVILYNLGLLRFTERSREYATLKVIGYRKKEINSIIRKDNFIQLVLGILIGIPAGLKFLDSYVQLASTDSFEYSSYISTSSFILAILIVVTCTLIVNQIVSLKVRKLNMIESLKSIE